MRVELTEVVWLEEHEVLTEAELAEASGLSDEEIKDLVEYGVIAPVDPRADRHAFAAPSITEARTARRLRRDFGLNTDGLALVMMLLKRIRELETEVGHMRAQLPQRTGESASNLPGQS